MNERSFIMSPNNDVPADELLTEGAADSEQTRARTRAVEAKALAKLRPPSSAEVGASKSAKQQLARRQRIETAALKLFSKQGFHGVGLRDVAKAARVSLGNIYNHYTGKEPLFESLMERLYVAFATDAAALADVVRDGAFPGDLNRVGRVIGTLVEKNRDYLTMVYVDIAEFGGKHAKPQYDNLAGKFAALMGPALTGMTERGQLNEGIDPAVAFTAVYLMFTNYFIIERSIGARPLGLKEDASVAALAKILSLGLSPRRSK
jgi:AcrR family transcriptional regulator